MHTLDHALHGCDHTMRDITNCVICERRLAPDRDHIDTCGERCFKRLLALQRGET